MHRAGIPVPVPGKNAHRRGSVTCAVFGGKSGTPLPDGENLVLSCDLAGLAVSAGSACHSGSSTPSRVLTAMGYGEKEALREVRLSFGDGTTMEEMERAYRILGDTALRRYGGKEWEYRAVVRRRGMRTVSVNTDSLCTAADYRSSSWTEDICQYHKQRKTTKNRNRTAWIFVHLSLAKNG